MIGYEVFLQDHLNYYFQYKEAERLLKAKRDNLYRSIDSLVSHPETTDDYKSHLLGVRRSI